MLVIARAPPSTAIGRNQGEPLRGRSAVDERCGNPVPRAYKPLPGDLDHAMTLYCVSFSNVHASSNQIPLSI